MLNCLLWSCWIVSCDPANKVISRSPFQQSSINNVDICVYPWLIWCSLHACIICVLLATSDFFLLHKRKCGQLFPSKGSKNIHYWCSSYQLQNSPQVFISAPVLEAPWLTAICSFSTPYNHLTIVLPVTIIRDLTAVWYRLYNSRDHNTLWCYSLAYHSPLI